MARKIELTIVGNEAQLEQTFRRAGKSAQGFERNISQASRGALAASLKFRGLGRAVTFAGGAFLGGAGFISAVKASVNAASDLNEQTSKTNVVFGQSAKSVLGWSKTTVTSMGLAQNQALATASSFGALLRPIGLTGTAAADQSKRLTQLGADLASFYNTSVQDALDAIRSGLVGETEPLRRYGALLSETRVQQEALTETGKRNAKQLTAHDKVLARIALIYKDTSQAQGDFGRTSGGLANQQRILAANVGQLEIVLGKALIPEVLRVVKATNEWLGKSKNQQRVTLDLKEAVHDVTAVVKAAAGGWRDFSGAVGGAKDALKLLISAAVTFKALKLAGSLGLIGTRARESATGVALLRTRLLELRRFGAITILVDLVIHKNEIDAWFKSHGLGFATKPLINTKGSPSPLGLPFSKDPFDTRPDSSGRVPGIHFNFSGGPGGPGGLGGEGGRAANRLGLPGSVSGSAIRVTPFSAAQQLRLGLLAHPDSLKLLKQQATADRAAIAFAAKRRAQGKITNAKFETIATAYYQDLNSTLDHIKSIEAAAAAKAAKRRKSFLPIGQLSGQFTPSFANQVGFAGSVTGSFSASKLTAGQLATLGLTSGGQISTLANKESIQSRFKRLSGQISKTSLNTSANQAEFKRIAASIKTGWGLLTDTAKTAIGKYLDGIDKALKGNRGDQTKFRHAALSSLLGGAGLSRDQRRLLASRFAQIGPGGTAPGGAAAFSGAGGIHFNAPVTITTNAKSPRDLQEQIEKLGRSRAAIRRGAR